MNQAEHGHPTALLAVEGLRTSFFTRGGELRAVDDVSFHVDRGEIVGLVGESGSGKTVTGQSILGLVDEPGRITGGRVLFHGEDLVHASAERLRELRGHRIAMIFQDPATTLNPVLRVGTQMVEAIRTHQRVSAAEARQRARDALGMMGIPSPEERLDGYPHQFSGGMRQRVAIAIAVLHEPDLVIADEPTTALDVTIQAQILHEVQRLRRDRGMAVIWISHDLSVVAGLVDRVCVMYAGSIIEQGSVDDVLDRPLHPYSRGLIDSVPSRNRPGQPLAQIPGAMPSLLDLAPGCRFQPRCPRADDSCTPLPALRDHGRRQVRCVHPLAEGER